MNAVTRRHNTIKLQKSTVKQHELTSRAIMIQYTDFDIINILLSFW